MNSLTQRYRKVRAFKIYINSNNYSDKSVINVLVGEYCNRVSGNSAITVLFTLNAMTPGYSDSTHVSSFDL